MQFELSTTMTLAVQPQLQWLWYSDQSRSFIIGDERMAFAIPLSDPGTPSQLCRADEANPGASRQHPCNLPMPAAMYDEFAGEPWHGFRFLERAAYEHAVDENGHLIGDLLRTLVFGPDYGHYVLHPASGLILSLRAGSIELLRRAGDGFESLHRATTRGRSALAFAAHPNESLIAYGDNYGAFHAHGFDSGGFYKATKMATKQRKASRLEFANGGQLLVMGGMGYLATLSYHGGKFAPAHELAISVRDFLWLNDGELVLVNQGLHGISAYRYSGDSGFNKLGEFKPEGAVQQMAVSKCGGWLAITFQQSSNVSLYRIAE